MTDNTSEFELNPQKTFEGLGFIGWLKLIFLTRAATIKQCDGVVRMMFDQMMSAKAEAEQAKHYQGRLAHLAMAERAALELAQVEMFNAGWHTADPEHPGRKPTYDAVVGALLQGMEAI